MKLSQYIYGRKPKAGLQVITRSRELPFFVQSWFESPRYGAAPVRSTPDRIWTQRYELQCFEGGAALSCLYPLKQTEVPCSEQTEPYIRGITPAVQHLLAGAEDADELVANISSALHFDGFHQIDDIYRLPSTFSEPLDFTPAAAAPAVLTDRERELCVDMAACLWQAFMARKDGKTGELAQRAVRLIVPAGTPAEELENQRRLAAYALDLLPAYIRRWTSLTLNMDVESESYPGGSALYGMARASADSQPTGKGVIFDAEKMVWNPAPAEERAYFQSRDLKQAVILLDDAVATLPVKFNLAFHLRLKNLFDGLCRGCVSVEGLQAFLKEEKLQEHRDALLPALARAVLANAGASPDRFALSSVWMLIECSQPAAQLLSTVQCSAEECLAVIIRNGVCANYPQLHAADEVFSQLALRLSAADHSPFSDNLHNNIRIWLDKLPEYTSFVEQLVNGLIQYGKIVISNSSSLLTWLENGFICRMQTLAGSASFLPLLDQIPPQTLAATLLLAADNNLKESTPWTTGVERLLIDWFNRAGQLPAWNDEQCLLVARRALALQDKQELWPVFAMRCADAVGHPIEACTVLLSNSWVRMLPQVQPLAQKVQDYVLQQNVNALCKSIRQPDDLLHLPEMWASITDGQTFMMKPDQWQQLLDPMTAALKDQNLQSLFRLLNTIYKQEIPKECLHQIETAVAIQMAFALPAEDLTARSYNELVQLINLSARAQNCFTPAGKQRLEIVQMLMAIVDYPRGREQYAAVRRGLATLTQDNRDMLNALLKMYAGDLPSSNLLQCICSDNSINWDNALPLIMKVFGLPDVSPNDIPKASEEDYGVFLSMLISLYNDEPTSAFGHLLSANDRNTLSDYLPANHPKLHKSLINEQKKYGDLPGEIVRGMHLNAGKR